MIFHFGLSLRFTRKPMQSCLDSIENCRKWASNFVYANYHTQCIFYYYYSNEYGTSFIQSTDNNILYFCYYMQMNFALEYTQGKIISQRLSQNVLMPYFNILPWNGHNSYPNTKRSTSTENVRCMQPNLEWFWCKTPKCLGSNLDFEIL